MKLGFLLISLCVSTIPGNDASERCDDWGVVTTKRIHAYDGEPARIRCPLFEDFLQHNYSTAHSAGLTLMWYWTGQGKDLEEPINIRLPDNRISKEKDTLWFRPALVNDTGNYTCMLRNTTYCSRIAFPWEVLQKDPGSCVSQAEKSDVVEFPLQHIGKLPCPDTEGYFPANVTPTVKWYMNCNLVDGFNERHPKGLILIFTTVRLHYEGNYTCIVTYEENGRQYNLTRTSPVKVIGAPEDEKPPTIVIPSDKTTYEFAAGEDLHLSCQVEFSFVKGSRNDIWWTVDGKNAEENTDPKMNVTTSVIDDIAGAKTIRKDLSIQHITAEQLMQNYTCSARNRLGALSQQARVKLKVGTPRYITELACGFGVTVFLVVCLIVVYHVYWLEMVLFYRAHFGTDETIGDGKEYDVYVSYARNAEEEEFVLVTLRGVLENEFGYKLCIFDRDSLPGGIITDETLSFIKKSRRLLVLISPSYVLQGTQALLELKAGLENMASQGSIRVILVQYKAIKSREKVKELKRAQAVLSVIKWKGEKSRFPGGRFWKQLHVALPVKHSCPTSARTNDTMEAVFDFIQRSRRMIVILSPDYLTDKSISMLEFKLGMVCQNAICTSLIIVEYKSLQGTHSTISKLKETIPFVRWEGESSRRNSSKFWKALRLALPLRSLTITTRSSWNESCSSQSDLSLDQIQKKKRRLKGTMATPSSKANPKDKNMAAGTEKAKNGPKGAKACQCCVTYCDSEHRLRSKCRAGAKPKWETRLCKPATYGNKTHWVQNGITQQAPATPPVTAFTLQQYTDLSNNNSDFYVL